MILMQKNASNPIVDLHYGLSRPCGDVNYHYQPRDTKVNDLMKVGECEFDMNGTVLHPEYIDTGLKESEYDVFYNNQILKYL